MAIIPVFIPHAGCPHQCVFCNQRTISGQKTAAVEGAKRQIEKWLAWIKPSRDNEAAFYGGSFTGLDNDLQRQLLSLTDELLQKNIIGSVRLSTRPDYIDGARLEVLLRHNVKLIELGVQSLDDAVLAAAERGHTAEQVEEAMSLLKFYGFKTGVQLMVGMPGQSFSSVRQTAEKAAAMQPDIARIYPLLVIKGTPLAQSCANGQFTPLTLDEAVEQSAWVYETLTKSGVKVIRVGLQPDDELCAAGNIIAGPFHPSMGELVQSFLLKNKITPLLEKQQSNNALIMFKPQMESKVRGLKNSNVQYWQRRFSDVNIVLQKADVDEVTVTWL